MCAGCEAERREWESKEEVKAERREGGEGRDKEVSKEA